jgi:hypothetical protein
MDVVGFYTFWLYCFKFDHASYIGALLADNTKQTSAVFGNFLRSFSDLLTKVLKKGEVKK